MLKISQYPLNADGTPMDLEVGVLTDASGNNGARLATPPIGPDNAPIDAKALVLVDSTGNLITDSNTISVATRAGLSTTINPVNNTTRFLTESGREGTFVFSTANLSAQVAADTQQWFYVAPASDTTGASGAWVRKRDAIIVTDLTAATGQALFTALPGIIVSPIVIKVRSLGYRTRGVGEADYIYDPAVDAAFVSTHPTWSFLAADGRGFRIDYSSGSVPFDAFGAYADRVTDDYPAWLAMQDFLLTTQIQLSANPYYRHLIPVDFSPAAYHFGTRLDCKIGTFTLRGASSPGIQNGGWGTIFEFAAGVGGLTLQDGQTMGETNDPTPQPNARGAYGSIISNILFRSLGGTTTHHYGLWVRVGGCRLINIGTQQWSSDGCVVWGTSGFTGDAAGGPNSTHVDGLISSYNNGAGLRVEGSDANAGDFRGIQCISNGTWGIYENSGLANVYIGGQMAGNGYSGSGRTVDTNVAAASACSYGGLWYFVVIGQAAAASTTVPGTDYTVWARHPGTGGPTASVPAWVSGMTWKEGGAAAVIGQSSPVTFVGLYTEGGQSPIQNPGGQGLFVGGTIGSQVYLNRGRLSGLNGLVNVGLGMRSYNTIADPVAGVTDITVGGSPSTKQIRKLVQSADASFGWVEKFTAGDIQFIYRASYTSYYITGDTTAMLFGRSAAPNPGAFAPVQLFTYNGRQISHGAAAPSTGLAGRGDIVINTSAVPSGTAAWICTTGGTNGSTSVWKTFGAISA